MRGRPYLGLPLAIAVTCSATAPIAVSQERHIRIRMDVDGQVVTATLDDRAISRDSAALLPLSLTLTDYARIERIADLPRKLSREGGLERGLTR